MRIIALLQEFPFPANNGMRSDISRRLKALHALGHQVYAISWTGGRLDPVLSDSELSQARALLCGLTLLCVDRSARRIANMARFPSQASGRWPRRTERENLIAALSDDAPWDCVWIDGIYAGPLGLWLADRLGLPLLYRSHNIEHRYTAEQAALASGRNKLSIGVGLIGLRRLEHRLHRQAALVCDISTDDLLYWREQGFAANCWLPPQADAEIRATMAVAPAERTADLLFFGSLSSPNNQAGLTWYLDAVHPLVQRALPDVKLMIAGRGPSPALAQRLEAAMIELVANPENAATIYARAKVMLNPILHGSGINIKTVDMFASGQTVVTTAKGARGLPPDIVAQLCVADDAGDFAQAVIDAVQSMRAGDLVKKREGLIDSFFGNRAVADVLERAMPTEAVVAG